MGDVDYDTLSKAVDLSVKTGDKVMDRWFKKHFDPSTGMWVHKHPDRDRLAAIAKLVRSARDNG